MFGFYCQTVNNLQKMCFKFIWNNKQDKISCKTAVKTGGLGVLDTRKYILAQKIMGVRKLKETKCKWGKRSFRNLSFYYTIYRFRPVWSKFVLPKGKKWYTLGTCFKAYGLLSYRIELQNSSELLVEPALHNEQIKIGNKVISYTQWIETDFFNLENFVENTGKLISSIKNTNKKYIR